MNAERAPDFGFLDLYPIKGRRDLIRDHIPAGRRGRYENDYLNDVTALLQEVERLRFACGIPVDHSIHFYAQGRWDQETDEPEYWYVECSCQQWSMRTATADREDAEMRHAYHAAGVADPAPASSTETRP